jgi:YHS domain-containing protein
MTGARRQKKAGLRERIAAAALAGVALLAPAMPAQAATTGRVVTDTLTGLAMSGFDPVAYFADRTPRMGDGAHEINYAGAVWRFCNEGNRVAFARDPAVYAPRFGGYDPVALVRGVAVPGHPLIWLIARDRLYLFSTPENRASFAAAVDRAAAAADHYWREVAPKLPP